ncbi:leucyl/phenylalanyl-tRNA--protein transferase, partial [Pseudomonas sp. MWU13-2625]
IRACAAPRDFAEGSWITEAMQDASLDLHRRAFAHSVDVTDQGILVGGLYGLARGQQFFGESMFSRADNASKFGFATLVQHLKEAGLVLIDYQMPTDHLHSLGALAIARSEFTVYPARYLYHASLATCVC